ncbi:hypothetical protein WICMUC_004881 [Wickerhamomyces mucosus]|uniref:Flap endonuclease 1 n=1 Tax=Wickerhamomyces mucosus TaxID=1378264 RepID=A0A9P8PED5_9ASCO|nr:hypothetical protein WICMUC_004881 [Wickerhamomyces mucosus]
MDFDRWLQLVGTGRFAEDFEQKIVVGQIENLIVGVVLGLNQTILPPVVELPGLLLNNPLVDPVPELAKPLVAGLAPNRPPDEAVLVLLLPKRPLDEPELAMLLPKSPPLAEPVLLALLLPNSPPPVLFEVLPNSPPVEVPVLFDPGLAPNIPDEAVLLFEPNNPPVLLEVGVPNPVVAGLVPNALPEVLALLDPNKPPEVAVEPPNPVDALLLFEPKIPPVFALLLLAPNPDPVLLLLLENNPLPALLLEAPNGEVVLVLLFEPNNPPPVVDDPKPVAGLAPNDDPNPVVVLLLLLLLLLFDPNRPPEVEFAFVEPKVEPNPVDVLLFDVEPKRPPEVALLLFAPNELPVPKPVLPLEAPNGEELVAPNPDDCCSKGLIAVPWLEVLELIPPKAPPVLLPPNGEVEGGLFDPKTFDAVEAPNPVGFEPNKPPLLDVLLLLPNVDPNPPAVLVVLDAPKGDVLLLLAVFPNKPLAGFAPNVLFVLLAPNAPTDVLLFEPNSPPPLLDEGAEPKAEPVFAFDPNAEPVFDPNPPNPVDADLPNMTIVYFFEKCVLFFIRSCLILFTSFFSLISFFLNFTVDEPYSLLTENAPLSSKSGDIKNFFGRKVAIDASMSLYQFLIAVRQQDGQQLTSEDGETTSHLMGMFYRTLRLIDNSIKPVYVFDGKPPVLKGGELEKRLARREEATKAAEALKESGTAEEIARFERRTVRVTKEQNEEAKKLLKLMGIPYVNAPCEAEAQCAELAKTGKVYAAASEDMDTLCYRTPYLLRHLTFSEQRKEPIQELDTEKVLEGLDMGLEQFIDLCILLGCDYCESIKGVGPITALKLIKEHKNIEGVIKYIESNPDSKYKVPEDWPYEGARELFLNPEVINGKEIELKWKEPNEEGLIQYMAVEKGFSEERVKAGIQRLKKGLKTGTQGRLDGFFKVAPKTKEQLEAAKKKRIAEEAAKKKNKKIKRRKKETTKAFKFEKLSNSLSLKFGAHIGASGGVSNSIINARNIGPRKWVSPKITDAEANEFKRLCDLHGYNPKTDILPHGSYFINLANPDKEKEEKAFGGFLDDLQRCEQLDIGLYNFHPGSSLDSDHVEAIKRLAKNINKAIAETTQVKIVIENMAGHGNLIGSNLQDLKDVFDLIERKDRVGFCLDTCHTFAAGYDIRTEEQFNNFLDEFDSKIGLPYLSAIHLNDSKAPLGANRDLHQRLGWGFLGLEVFRAIANCERLKGIPIVLETPAGNDDSIWGEEIKLLEWLIGRTKDDEKFLAKAKDLSDKGLKERNEQLDKYEKKQATKKRKETKASPKSAPKRQKHQKTLD